MPIEDLSHKHNNTTLLKKVLNPTESHISRVSGIKYCEREIQNLLEVVRKYCERTSEPLTDSDKKFLEACKNNVHVKRRKFRQFVQQLKSSATQALAQPALAQPDLDLQQAGKFATIATGTAGTTTANYGRTDGATAQSNG